MRPEYGYSNVANSLAAYFFKICTPITEPLFVSASTALKKVVIRSLEMDGLAIGGKYRVLIPNGDTFVIDDNGMRGSSKIVTLNPEFFDEAAAAVKYIKEVGAESNKILNFMGQLLRFICTKGDLIYVIGPIIEQALENVNFSELTGTMETSISTQILDKIKVDFAGEIDLVQTRLVLIHLV